MIDQKFYLIDAHCHIYPEKIASLAVAHTDNFYSEKSWGTGTTDDLLTRGEKAGIDKFIVQSVATTPKQVRKINSFIADEVSLNSTKFVGLGTMHPESDDIEGDVQNLIDLGLKGVKIHPDIQEFNLDHKGYIKLYELCSKAGLPVLMHTGDYRYDHSNPNRLVPMLKDFPQLTVVGAHFGGWSIQDEALEKLKDFNNFYVDCSSSFNYMTNEKAKSLILGYGVDKVLFATDYPMWDMSVEINKLLSMNFTEEEYKKIFSENAKKVYKL